MSKILYPHEFYGFIHEFIHEFMNYPNQALIPTECLASSRKCLFNWNQRENNLFQLRITANLLVSQLIKMEKGWAWEAWHFGKIQGVPKLMAHSITYNNMKAKRDRFMVYLLMTSPCFSTQALMRSGLPHIRLSSVSAKMLLQAERTLLMTVAI